MNPAWGGATIGAILRREGLPVSDPTVRRYMTEMGLATIYPGPNLSKRTRESLIYPCLLRHLDIYNTFRPHQGLGGLTPHEVFFGEAAPAAVVKVCV